MSLVILGGCSGSASDWNGADDQRQAELAADPWVSASGTWDVRAPAPQWSRAEPADGVWERPSVERSADVAGSPWRVVADEVESAQEAGWEPVFVRCAPGSVIVDVVRPLEDGSVATARVEAQDATDVGGDLVVTAVARHHSDGEWVAATPTHAPDGFDLGTCLEAEAPMVTWSGVPVLLKVTGGPEPTDR